jgi:CRP/FNR family transcriptional regulator, nitrogen fixation regulation protein
MMQIKNGANPMPITRSFSPEMLTSDERPAPLRPGNNAPGSLTSALDLMGAQMRFPRNAEIFGEGEPAEYLYRVVRGAVRISTLLSDGRRQIGAFYLPGDVFGLEAGELHAFSAEAIADTTVVVVKRSSFEALAGNDRTVAHELRTLLATHLRRAHQHMLLLGRKNAQERIASFLLQMAERAPAAQAVELPMSRQDIADYLGLTIETVSRTFTHLENAAAITLTSSRQIVLRNRAALARMDA